MASKRKQETERLTLGVELPPDPRAGWEDDNEPTSSGPVDDLQPIGRVTPVPLLSPELVQQLAPTPDYTSGLQAATESDEEPTLLGPNPTIDDAVKLPSEETQKGWRLTDDGTLFVDERRVAYASIGAYASIDAMRGLSPRRVVLTRVPLHCRDAVSRYLDQVLLPMVERGAEVVHVLEDDLPLQGLRLGIEAEKSKLAFIDNVATQLYVRGFPEGNIYAHAERLWGIRKRYLEGKKR